MAKSVKRSILLILLLMGLITVLASFLACEIEEDKQPKKIYYSITYLAGEGGQIGGKSEQTVKAGENGEEVTAVPDEGYIFSKWSDGITTATRQDTKVTSDITVTAEFVKEFLNVSYSAGTAGGYVKGNTTQQVRYGQDAEEVTAWPYTGYYFVRWSDGVTTATRRDINLTSDLSVTAEFDLLTYTVKYIAGKGGTIIGDSEQQVRHGERTESVTAVPDEGYMFVKWSDGYLIPHRLDSKINQNITYTAQFDVLVKTFTLDYKFIAEDADKTDITLTYGKLDDVTFPTPTKEHYTFVGWFANEGQITEGGWAANDTQVTDENGNVIAGNELFYFDNAEFYAKWTAEPQFTYKILLVYITEINGVFKGINGEYIAVNYKMSEVERKIYHNMTIKLREIMNYLLDGLVEFEVEEYYTTRPLSDGDFHWNTTEYYIEAYEIDEVRDLYRFIEYGSVLTAINMNDYEHNLNLSSGLGGTRYASVYFEALVGQALLDGDSLEDFTDINYWRWNSIRTPMQTFVHEIAHTMELQIDLFSSHRYYAANYEYLKKHGQIEVIKGYLLNEAKIDGDRIAGIPYEFWAGEIT